jgi:hypothetical protein
MVRDQKKLISWRGVPYVGILLRALALCDPYHVLDIIMAYAIKVGAFKVG